MTSTTASRASQVVTVDPASHTFVMERTFDAPRERVFQAFASCESVSRWWGPTGWTLPFCEMDFRPGGTWRYGMRGPDGAESWGLAVYREVNPHDRLTYTDQFIDAAGNLIAGMPTMEIELEFRDLGGRTRFVSTTLFDSAESLQAVIDMGAEQGAAETWDRLEAELARAD